MIKEAFVSFDTAKLLKEKEFDVPCASYYREGSEENNYFTVCVDYSENWNQTSILYSRPTLQMALAWLREIHTIDIDILSDCGRIGVRKYTPFIHTYLKTKSLPDGGIKTQWKQKRHSLHYKGDEGNIHDPFVSFSSYEDAAEEAVRHTLNNLI